MVELIFQVDENDIVIGAKLKKDFYKTDLIHRSAHLLLFNSKNEILIQKRSMQKIAYPNLWDIFVSGTVSFDESYEQTIEREMKGELRISVPYKKIFKFRHVDKEDSAFKTVFLGTCNGNFKLQNEEVFEIKWISIENLKKEMKEKPELFCNPFIVGFKKYLEYNE